MILTTNSPVSSMLASVSFLPSGELRLRQTEKPITGGSWPKQPEYEYGARLPSPFGDIVETNAIGLGAYAEIISGYAECASGCSPHGGGCFSPGCHAGWGGATWSEGRLENSSGRSSAIRRGSAKAAVNPAAAPISSGLMLVELEGLGEERRGEEKDSDGASSRKE
eukprot:scaffold78860_cov30-Tisochrysis_lutea.AAC.1